jgi:glutaconate CoA-transferase subunit B
MTGYTTADLMAIAMSRSLSGKKNAFHGVASPLPMVAILLARALYGDSLTYLNITGGVNVQPEKLSPSTDGYNLFQGTASCFGLTDIFDLAARGGLDVAFLSGVQIDVQGRLNNSVIGSFPLPKVKLPGGAGSAVLLPNAKSVFVWRTKHDRRSFVENLDFVTAAGNIEKVFTPLCTFVLQNRCLIVSELMPGITPETVKENTGFAVDLSQAADMPPPTAEELETLHRVDPNHIREVEF